MRFLQAEKPSFRHTFSSRIPLSYRNITHPTTKKSPANLMLRRKLLTTQDFLKPAISDTVPGPPLILEVFLFQSWRAATKRGGWKQSRQTKPDTRLGVRHTPSHVNSGDLLSPSLSADTTAEFGFGTARSKLPNPKQFQSS